MKSRSEIERIIHISPELPPKICGVGDYATIVCSKMAELYGHCSFSLVSCGANPLGSVHGQLNVRSRDEFWTRCHMFLPDNSVDSTLILHFTGYGYSRDGLPNWLVDAIERRPVNFPRVKIITFFHELYANGRFWQRSYWTSRYQKELAIRLARASDLLLTNRGASARWLEQISGRAIGSVPHVPICSTIGEPKSEIGWSDRPGRAVTFGSKVSKEFVFGSLSNDICRMLKSLNIGELIDIGEKLTFSKDSFQRFGIEVRQLGRLSADLISNELANCRVAFLDYNPEYLEKSSVFAAFAAHGVPCVMPHGSANDAFPYFTIGAPPKTLGELEQFSIASHQAYQNRSAAVHAKTMMDLVTTDDPRI